MHNPDFSDKSNTSLHLASQHGQEEIAELLISLGHDSSRPVEDWIYSNTHDNLGISVNTDGHTPLHLAAAHSQAAVVELLCREFPQTVTRRDAKGQTPLHLASSSQIMPKPNANPNTSGPTRLTAQSPEDNTTIDTLLASGADVNAKDNQGNTCLHNASAWGNLKAIRALIQAGADPLSKNKAGWTPQFYSITVQAEVYYRNMVAEFEKKKAEDEVRASERRGRGGGAIRVVSQDNDSEEDGGSQSRASTSMDRSTTRSPMPGMGRVTPGAQSDAGLGLNINYVDAWK